MGLHDLEMKVYVTYGRKRFVCHFDKPYQLEISLKPWPDLQNLGSMIDNLNLYGKVLLKLEQDNRFICSLQHFRTLGKVVYNKIHLENGILCHLLVIDKEPENNR